MTAEYFNIPLSKISGNNKNHQGFRGIQQHHQPKECNKKNYSNCNLKMALYILF
jgi:hypothetical protein